MPSVFRIGQVSASERAESARQGQPDSGAFKITPRFERRYLENEKSYRFDINSVYEGEFSDSYDVRIVEIFEIYQKL